MSAPAPSADRFSEIFDLATHQIFPARTKLKDLAYWVTEISAAVYLLILILQNGLQKDRQLTTSDGEEFTVYRFENETGGLLFWDCELAWIALIYTMKYVVYIVDTALMIKNKHSPGFAVVPVVLNFAVWLIWALYGFLASERQILSGFAYSGTKDGADALVELGVNTREASDANVKRALDAYKKYQKGTWIWIPCSVACAANLACWIVGLVQKKSTLFTNAAISTWLIPLQLCFFNLAMNDSWFKPVFGRNILKIKEWSNNHPPSASAFRGAFEIFEARYIFIIIYFTSWLLVLAAFPTIWRAVKELKKSVLNGIKYFLYALFFISNFFWCLLMDAILFETYVAPEHRDWLIIFSLISIGLALAIGIISLIQKFREDEVDYFRKHGHTPVDKPEYR